MAFFVYIAVLLVSISGILLELDWLTKPKLETKSPVQAVTTIVAPAQQANAKVEGQSTDLTPVYPKKPDTPQSAVYDAAASAPAATQPPAANASTANTTPQEQEPAAATNGAVPPAQQTDRSTTGSAPLNTPETLPAPTAVVPPSAQSPSVAAAPNRCNVQACSSAYQSFRASDCTYQPFEGPRRICERPPANGRAMASQARAEPRGEATYRKRGEDADRDVVVRHVRPIDAEIDDADDRGTARGRVIVIEQLTRRSW